MMLIRVVDYVVIAYTWHKSHCVHMPRLRAHAASRVSHRNLKRLVCEMPAQLCVPHKV